MPSHKPKEDKHLYRNNHSMEIRGEPVKNLGDKMVEILFWPTSRNTTGRIIKATMSQMATFWGFPTVFTGMRFITVNEEDAQKGPAFFYVLGILIKECKNQAPPQNKAPNTNTNIYASTVKKDQPIAKNLESLLQEVSEPPEENAETTESSDGNKTIEETLIPDSPTQKREEQNGRVYPYSNIAYKGEKISIGKKMELIKETRNEKKDIEQKEIYVLNKTEQEKQLTNTQPKEIFNNLLTNYLINNM
ncbi:hypothetical protein CHS0354_032963 [Potamilus streckersoni]|uniref:Uncharacterized protein n=1 Tax=Potamilus streckersoni TaxID=2493646 RepID=A0AAE0RX11_9BIVA|nr:hypothetical protein CHS0354_032963 [Potamilus streckersoni]